MKNYLPKNITWFRLPEYVKDLMTKVNYKEYVAYISPTNGGDPIVRVLSNTLDFVPNWINLRPGNLGISINQVESNNLIKEKTFISSTSTPFLLFFNNGDGEEIQLYNYDDKNTLVGDFETFVTIRVYN